MKNLFRKIAFYSLLLVSTLCLSCNKSDGKSESIDVRFEIPERIEVSLGQDKLQFRVQFSKAPMQSDLIVLVDPTSKSHDCEITEVNSSNFSIRLYSGMISGNYNVYLKRGTKQLLMGKTEISVSTNINTGIEIKPKPETTIYGAVVCNGKGVKDVVVSDGVIVTKTDDRGVYELASAKKYGYVWISVPSGYEVLSQGILPLFWQSVSGNSAQRRDFELKQTDNQNFTMYILGDMHLANRNNDGLHFRSFASDLNSTISATPGKEYVLTLGDMTWDLYWYDNNFGFTQYLALANTLFKDIQFFHTMGNHDNDYKAVGDFDKEVPFRDMLCPTFYSYNIGQIHFIVVDDIDYNNAPSGKENRGKYTCDITPEQMQWLKKDLATVDKSTPIIVSTHAPVYRPNNSIKSFTPGLLGQYGVGTEEFVSAFDGYKVHFFTGHTHKTFNYDNLSAGSVFEHNAGSVCGDWWWSASLSGEVLSQDGTPGGYTVLTVNGKDMKWQYKSTGHNVGFQFRAYDMNEVKKVISPELGGNKDRFVAYVNEMNAFEQNTVVLNIWNYDPQWNISIKENGKELEVKEKWMNDPFHVLTYSAPMYKKSDSPNFPTEPHGHFFYVQASSANSSLDIKITDRFGNVYTETMSRPKTFSVSSYK